MYPTINEQAADNITKLLQLGLPYVDYVAVEDIDWQTGRFKLDAKITRFTKLE